MPGGHLDRSGTRARRTGPDVAIPTNDDERRGLTRFSGAGVAVAVVDLLAVICLVLFFVVGGPFGFVNDVANAVVGVLSAVLAWTAWTVRRERLQRLAPAAAALGAVLMVAGSMLVIFDVTGYFLAGLVSAVGAAFIGSWLLVANSLRWHADELPQRVRRVGLAAGLLMLTGLLAVAGVLAGVDDQGVAPGYVSAAQLSWLGTYLLYPIWCFRLARTTNRRTR